MMQSQLEKSAHEVYKKFLDIMLYDIPLKQLDDLVVGDVAGYGTTLDEKILEIGRLRKIVIDQREQGAEYEMNFVINPVHRRINLDNGPAIFIDEIEITMNVDGDKNIIPIRFSTVMELINDSWKIVHLHGSVAVNTEEDTWHKEEHFRKIEALEKLVSEKTEDLVKKNRELEIETALEKVRSSALAMKEPADMVEVCNVISDQLQLMGVKDIRNVQTAIIDEQKGTYHNYQYFASYKKGVIEETDYNNHPTVLAMVHELKKSANSTFTGTMNGDELNNFREWRKQEKQFPDPLLDEVNSAHYYFYSIGLGGLGLTTYKPLPEEGLEIFEKFHNVFSLAYRRFIDIEKAEAQASEAEIQLALERVRARAMAMHNSNELAEVAKLLFGQLKYLGVESFSSGFNIWDDAHKNLISWMSNDTGDIQPPFELPIHEFEQHRRLYSAWEKDESFTEDDIKGKALVKHYKFLRSFPLLDESFNLAETAGIKIPERQVHNIAFFSYGYLLIITLEPCPQFHPIFQRFAKVFNQTYTRFLDLKKVEAQARESQIEVALERVRSRSMAMHSSDEFVDTSDVMVNQLKELGIETLRIGIGIINEEDNSVEIWSKSEIKGKVKNTILGVVPGGIHPIFDNMVDAWKEKKSFYSSERVGDEVKEYYEKLDPCLSYPKRTEFNERETMTAFFFNHGSLNVISLEPLKEEDCNIMIRFAKVFGQIYQRFLDLQIAEAQAREAQIEAALERVRSRSMGMHGSDELKDVIQTVYEQLVQLNIHVEHSGFIMDYKRRDDMHIWLADNHEVPSLVTIPYFDSPHWNSFNEAKEKGIDFFANNLSFEEKNKFYHDLFKFIPDVPEETKDYYFNCPGLAISTVLLENVGLYIENFSGIPYSNEENATLIRFGKVFQQTYTRFLDLQKAEVQAREAQIEAALERVRSRSMAMHKSEELADLSFVLVKQIQALGVSTWFCAFNIYDDDQEGSLEWGSNAEGTYPKYRTPREGIFLRYYEAGQRGETLLVNEIGENECATHYDYLCSLPGVGEQLLKMRDAGISFPESQIDHVAYFKYGYIIFITFEPALEAHDIFKRFAKIFEQTYTRFLDLQKAEVRAREAQIEMALEKVRSKAMAMHKSEDLTLAVASVFAELDKLGLKTVRCGIGIFNDLSRKVNVWTASLNGDMETAHLSGNEILEGHPLLDKIFEAWVNQQELSYTLEGKDLEEYYSVTEGSNFPVKSPEVISNETVQYYYCVMFPAGGLFAFRESEFSTEAKFLMKRFADVFQLSFTRHLDLKKAEAQARESQIEAALERVRARTMAMQKSNELAQTGAHLFSQLNDLGIKPYRCNIAIVDDKSKSCQIWSTTNSGNVIPTVSALPLNEYPVLIDWYNGWVTQKSTHVIKLFGKERVTWTKYISKYLPFEEYKKNNIDKELLIKEAAYFNNFYFKQGFFMIHSKEELTEVQLKIIKRFALVFEQTYTRFLDLENAEKQNKLIQAENERKTEELEEARQLQLAMLPKELPQLNNLDIAVYMKTATEVGGDYYDFNVDENGTLTVVVGDATGHGMKAGTMVTITKSLFNSLGSSDNILKTFKRISEVIKNMKFRQLSMCLQMIKITGSELSISSAAMPPAFVYYNNDASVEEILLSGMPLGAMLNFQYKIEKRKLKSGDVIFMLSDGLPELQNNKKHMYGYEKIKTELKEVGRKSPQKIVDHFEKSANEWLNGSEQDDDVTFVVIKVK